jgi:RimJ/RimL family protein N-acetyltransferase
VTAATPDPIVDGDATLRMLTTGDLPATMAWRNHPESRGWFHSTGEISAERHAEWFRRYLERDDDYVLILEIAGVPVAQVAVYDVSDGAAEFGRLLVDPAARGRGISHRAIALCLRFATDVLGVREIYLEVKRDNVRAIRAYEAAGFRVDESREGTDGSLAMLREIP